MSGVIKLREAGGSADVRPLGETRGNLAAQYRPDPVEVEMAALRHQIESLNAEITRGQEELAHSASAVRAAYQDGLVAGRREGHDEAETAREESLHRLDAGISLALTRIDRDLTGLERLAAQLAKHSLEKMIGCSDQRTALLAETIAHQVRDLDSQSIVEVLVSSAEFPDPDDLAVLASQAGRPQLQVAARDDLRPGECRIKLRVGSLDVGIDQQWSRLRQALDRFAIGEAA